MMQSYAEYKDSGVNWLGEIPAGWEVKKAKWLWHEIEERSQSGTETLLSVSQYKGVIPRKGGSRSEDLSGYKSVYKDHLVTNIMLAWMGGLGISEFDGIVSPAYSVYRLKVVAIPRFLGYLYRTNAFLAEFARRSRGVVPSRWRMYTEDFGQISTILPPLPEQTAIAHFLDDKTAKIDALLKIKRRQIELLSKRKQILIQNAVTKGLNPDAPMKDSGVDWIGPIPAHWRLKPAKHLFFEVDERSENGDEELLSVSHLTGVTPRSEKSVSMFLAEDYSGSKICVEGDLVFNIMWAWMGALGVSAQLGIVSPSYAVFRQLKAKTFNPVYLEMLMQSLGYIEHYNKVSTGLHSSRLRFYSHMFLSMKIGYPTFEEQERIVEFLTKETGNISKAVSILEIQITKLNEYKTTLINAAVTGKIKVT